jgi:hypothetical protein
MEMKRARRPRSGEDSASQALGCGNEGEADGEAGGGNGGRGGELGEETGDKERGDSSNSPSRLAVQGKGWEELRRDAEVVIWMEIKKLPRRAEQICEVGRDGTRDGQQDEQRRASRQVDKTSREILRGRDGCSALF